MKWNTAATVVEIIEAETKLEAIGRLEGRLRADGYEPYDDMGGHYPDAFKSEDQ